MHALCGGVEVNEQTLGIDVMKDVCMGGRVIISVAIRRLA